VFVQPDHRSIPLWKRTFDILVSLLGLLCLWPLFIIIALFIKLDSQGPVFFRQERIGQGFRPFRICKFRTMVADASSRGSIITAGHDPRITRIGRILRQTKLDELPQLINVLRGEMSLVGPRPEVRHYVELFRSDYEDVLAVRPGITDLASLKYRDEEAALGRSRDPEYEYRCHVLPDKIALAREYARRSSFLFDLALIAKTFKRVFFG
jgi:lipopolysaccharide/colanic/teichoic acid biosynthesis glycosyltransferase